MSETPAEYLPDPARVIKEIKAGEDVHDTLVTRYDRAYDVYRAASPRGIKKEPWESTLRIPYAQQGIDTALVNMIGGPPRARVRPRREQDVESAEAMQVVLDYHVGEDHLAEKQPVFVQQALVYGITAAKNHWLYREGVKPRKEFVANPADPMRPIWFETSETVTLRDGPTFEPWDIYDLWWEPNARDVDTAAYIVLRSWLSKDELLRNARSEQNPYGLYDLAQIEKLLEDGPQQMSRATAQERYVGGPQEKRKDRYEILEVWRDDTLTVIGNRRATLRHRENPYSHGKKPVVIAQVRPDLFEMQGIAETELIDHLQQAMHTVHQMRMDNLHLTVQRGVTFREGGIADPNSLVLRPRFRWGVTDHDDIQFRAPDPLPPESYREDDVLLARMQLITGINPYISGADSAGVDQNTATGVTALQEVASRLLRFKARMINYKGLVRTFEQWGELVQQFMSEDQQIRIEGPDGYSWRDVSPQEIVGNYDFAVEGTEESLSRQQERGEAIALLNALAPFAQLPGLNLQPVLEKVAKAYDVPPATIFQQPQQQAPAAPQGGQAPGGDPRIGQNENGSMIGGQQLSPDILGAIQGGGYAG